MKKILAVIQKKYFDNTVELSKLSKTFLLWSVGLAFVYVTNILLIKIIGLQQYGQYAVFMSWVSIAAIIVAFGWDGYLLQKIPLLSKDNEEKIIGRYLIKKLLLSVVACYAVLVIILCTGYFLFHVFPFFTSVYQLAAFCILIFLVAVVNFLKSFLKIFHKVTVIQLLEDLLKPLIIFLAIAFFFSYAISITLTDLYLLNVIVFAAFAISLLLFCYTIFRKNFSAISTTVDKEKWLQKCFYFMCIFLGYNVFTRMELIFLGYFNNNEAAAKYQVLLRVADLVILPEFLFNYYLPQKFSRLFAEKEYEKARSVFSASAKTISLLQLLCFAGVAAIGYFYLWSFNLATTDMYLYLLLLSSAPIFYSLFGSGNLALKTSGNERYSFYALAIVLLLEMPANILLVPKFGLAASVIISWASILIYNLVLAYFVYKRLGYTTTVTRRIF